MNRAVFEPAGVRRRASAAAVVVAAVLAVTACSTGDELPVPSSAATPSATSSATSSSSSGTTTCNDPTQSYAPGNNPTGGSTVTKIKQRGRLIAGVSADTRLMGARNPETGTIEGFDISVLRALSQAIFGSPDRIEFKVITTADRIKVLQDGSVDVVARAFTMTCARWNDIAFSAEYYQAAQKVLVPTSYPASTTLASLKGKKVCAPTGSTTIATLQSDYPDVTAIGASNHTDCLVLFQNGTVDAITGDDTILAGLAAQDPYAKVVGAGLTVEPYGIGVKKGDVAFVQYLNRVIAQMEADGAWAAAYDQWLKPYLGNGSPPDPKYGRT